jgi:hypothetical protein
MKNRAGSQKKWVSGEKIIHEIQQCCCGEHLEGHISKETKYPVDPSANDGSKDN